MLKCQQKPFVVSLSASLAMDEHIRLPLHPATQGGTKLKVKQVQPPGNYTYFTEEYG